MTHKTIQLPPAGPSKALEATHYGRHGLLSLAERGPKGGYYTTSVPAEALPPLLDFLAERGVHATRVGELLKAATAMLHAFGDNVPDWLREEAAALSTACANAEGFPGEQPIRVLVALEGGTVQGAVADRSGVAVTVLDYDTEGADADRVFAIPQRGAGTSDAYVAEHDADHDPAFIDAAQAAKLSEPEEAIAELRHRAAQWASDSPKLAAAELARAEEIEAQLASEAA